MEELEYGFWYNYVKQNMDVKMIAEHYIQNYEVVKEYLSYIDREERANNDLIHCLLKAGWDYTEIEELVYGYSGVIQNVYLEIGLKIGTRLGAEYLL